MCDSSLSPAAPTTSSYGALHEKSCATPPPTSPAPCLTVGPELDDTTLLLVAESAIPPRVRIPLRTLTQTLRVACPSPTCVVGNPSPKAPDPPGGEACMTTGEVDGDPGACAYEREGAGDVPISSPSTILLATRQVELTWKTRWERQRIVSATGLAQQDRYVRVHCNSKGSTGRDGEPDFGMVVSEDQQGGQLQPYPSAV
jgi:hypothetical protein